MVSFYAGSKESSRLQYGWDCELECLKCKHIGQPKIYALKQGKILRAKKIPVLHMTLHCLACGQDLQREAESEIVKLFSDIHISKKNAKLITWNRICSVCLSFLLLLCLYFSMFTDFPIRQTFPSFVLISLVFIVVVKYFVYQFTLLKKACACGSTKLVFMGSLGQSYCFRCASCGTLVKIDD